MSSIDIKLEFWYAHDKFLGSKWLQKKIQIKKKILEIHDVIFFFFLIIDFNTYIIKNW